MGNGKVLEGLSGPRRKKKKKKIIGRLETAKTRESRDAQIGVGTMYEELCITC